MLTFSVPYEKIASKLSGQGIFKKKNSNMLKIGKSYNKEYF